jgi:Fe-S-cluster formation regulator IscX/YfhJ
MKNATLHAKSINNQAVLGVSLNTGRCSTVSLSEYFGWSFNDEAFVWHEPFHESELPPRIHFRQYENLQWSWESPESCIPELDRIKPFIKLWRQILRGSKNIIVFGYTIYPLIPLIISAFPGAVRILHLVRHPVAVAASMTNNGLYDPIIEKDNPAMRAELDPRLTSTFHPEYAKSWETLTPFEKNLYRWAEINLYAKELHEFFPEVPFMTVRIEDMNQEIVDKMASFFGLHKRAGESMPRFNRQKTNRKILRPIKNASECLPLHPHIIEVAESLGYDCSPEAVRTITRSYQVPYRLHHSLTRFMWRIKWIRIAVRSLKMLTSAKHLTSPSVSDNLRRGIACGCRQNFIN